MSKTEFDRDKPDNESMFDFLSEDEGRSTARKIVARKAKRKSMPTMPTIRKPVPVSKSGPLVAPKPGDPVEPPPALTTGKAEASPSADDMSFLDDTRAETPDLSPVSKKSFEKNLPGNVPKLNQPSANDEASDLAREFSSLGRDKLDDLDFGKNWDEGRDNFDRYEASSKDGRVRWLALGGAAICLIGGVSYLFSFGKLDQFLPTQVDSAASIESGLTDPTVSGISSSSDENTVVETVQASSLMPLFLDQQSAIEAFVSQGALDEAQRALSSMDRTLYGYGASEFRALESRIALLKSESNSLAGLPAQESESLRLTEAQRADELAAARVEEADRQAQELAAQEQAEEATRLAQELVAQEQAEEATRLAQELAKQEQAAESVRLANIEIAERQAVANERLELERIAKQEAEAEADRIVQRRFAAEQAEALRVEQAAARSSAQRAEDAARLQLQKVNELQTAAEAARQEQQLQARVASVNAAARADKIRLDALEETARDEARRQISEADRLATDRRIAEDRAAAERRTALEQRIIRAREIEAANAAAETVRQTGIQISSRNTAVSGTQNQRQSDDGSIAPSTGRQITDPELQSVYRQFSELQKAIAERDIARVVDLTERSGLRVQQFMQVFENSVDIDVRIQNISTSNATGEINGTLQIQSIERADGSRVVPPANLKSIRISTRREGNGWSTINW